MSKLIVILIGTLIGLGIVGSVLGLLLSLLAVGGLGASMLGRRDWVPVVYNLRSLTVRKVSTLFTALGLALVVFVFATVLMLAHGIRKTLTISGSDDNVIVLRKGAQAEVQSALMPEHVRLLAAAPEVAIGRDGKPLSSAELVVLIFALRESAKNEQDGSNVTVRGVGPHALEVHPAARVEGRLFTPGTSEVVIGKSLVGRFQGMQMGGEVQFARRGWKVVGVLDGGGSGFDSEIWGDVEQFEDAFQRRPTVSTLTMRLKDRDQLSAITARVAADPQLNQLEVKRERDYYAAQSEAFATFVKLLGLFVAIIFAVGAALGAMITMYAQVAARTREIGTLRALGFRRRAVLLSFLVESVFMAVIAGCAGIAGASLMQLASFSTMNFTSFSEVTFRFVLTPSIIVNSSIFAALMGYAGGLLPAVRASRKPIIEATRGG